ncbi:hypothetical protein HIM_07164 [Hirsutella minnesotensis 3608]|uniref:RNase MRP protein 1 RNA binding domain-containing protein n=1 Tax=Hirsutella minnesotensis 3608 TaxID=1043627 RepID=A0A0F7ZN97_9HYPO|nr:hypothetical protein HIM_07164 [Hirsutella minnesotensis 3608]
MNHPLRRGLRRLDECLLRARPARSSPVPRRHDAVARARWLTTHAVQRAYVAFTQLAADNQYAPLGLLLLAVLARIHNILVEFAPAQLPPATAPDVSQQQPALSGPSVANPATAVDTPDHGVTVARLDVHIGGVPAVQTDSTVSRPKHTKPQNEASPGKDGLKTKRTKKRRGGDALSSLFSSLS